MASHFTTLNRPTHHHGRMGVALPAGVGEAMVRVTCVSPNGSKCACDLRQMWPYLWVSVALLLPADVQGVLVVLSRLVQV